MLIQEHETSVLRDALDFAAGSSPLTIPPGTIRPTEPKAKVLFDIHSARNLGLIIDELLRAVGITIHVYGHHGRVALVNDLGHGPTLDMPTARKFALRLLNTQSATLEDIDRMIEEVCHG